MIICPYCSFNIDDEEFAEKYPTNDDDRCPLCGGLLVREVEQSLINQDSPPVVYNDDEEEEQDGDLTRSQYSVVEEFI